MLVSQMHPRWEGPRHTGILVMLITPVLWLDPALPVQSPHPPSLPPSLPPFLPPSHTHRKTRLPDFLAPAVNSTQVCQARTQPDTNIHTLVPSLTCIPRPPDHDLATGRTLAVRPILVPRTSYNLSEGICSVYKCTCQKQCDCPQSWEGGGVSGGRRERERERLGENIQRRGGRVPESERLHGYSNPAVQV